MGEQSAKFKAFPKIPRLNRQAIVTEKIDGTNAAIGIIPDGEGNIDFYCQSRKRIITPNSLDGKGSDNFGFAEWAYERKTELIDLLGPGLHYGEWWGQGINRAYGLDHRRFSLFNTHRWAWLNTPPTLRDDHAAIAQAVALDVWCVPVLGDLPTLSDSDGLAQITAKLSTHGSQAAVGFDNPEGVVVFHSASNQVFKVLLENDDVPKSVADGLVAVG